MPLSAVVYAFEVVCWASTNVHASSQTYVHGKRFVSATVTQGSTRTRLATHDLTCVLLLRLYTSSHPQNL